MVTDLHDYYLNGLCVGPFRVEYACGEAGREDEYRLRYEIFVEEYKWLAPKGLENRLERDEFDAASCAFVLRHIATGEVAACQRYVLPERLPPGRLTQIEHLTGGRGMELERRPTHTWAEASRTSIAPKYRWGAGATIMPTMLVMKYASLALALALGRTTIFSVSDPRTARLTRRLDVPLHRIGPVFKYYGDRAPYRMDVPEMLATVPVSMAAAVGRLTTQAVWACYPR